MVLKSFILTGCGMTSKVGTKAAALKASAERFLQDFGEYDVTIFHNAEKYLVNVIYSRQKCETFDDLRYHQYTMKNTTLTDLPPTSRSIRGHLLRSHSVGFFYIWILFLGI